MTDTSFRSTAHNAFRVARTPAAAALQFKVTLAVAAALVIGIALGAASIVPRSGWSEAKASALTPVQDAWLGRPAASRG